MSSLEAKKVILATFGTLGDIYPFIAIALALRRRGFTPVISAPAMHGNAIKNEGIAFALMRPHEDDILRALGVDIPGAFKIMLKNPYFILDEIYLRFLSETFEDVMRAREGACIIIVHSLLVGAHQVAEKLGLPCARVALAPMHLQSAAAPSVTPPAPYVIQPKSSIALRYNQFVRAIVRFGVDRRMSPLRRFRKAIGLPSTGEDFFLDFGRKNSAQVIFGLFSPHLAPAQPDHPDNIKVPGFPFYEPADADRRSLDPALLAFLSKGEPPVIFTLGSFAPEVSGEFYDQSIGAVRALGLRAVLLAGEKDAARLASLAGPNEFICEKAPHRLLFPQGRCIVHHGGIGTTTEALRAGRPQIVVPFFGDQPDHGARIERFGVGLTIKLSRYNERRAVAALQRLNASTYFEKAANVAALILADTGVESIADWAEHAALGLEPVCVQIPRTNGPF